MTIRDRRAEAEAKLVEDVDNYGWHVLNVFTHDEKPGFSYSIGMHVTLEHPDIVIVGLPSTVAHSLINLVGEAIREGRAFQDGSTGSGFIQGYDCLFRAVPRHVYPDYFGMGIWFYGDKDFPVLQLVYPDREGRWPWEDGVTEDVRRMQPVLAEI